MSNAVTRWLQELGLGEYAQAFEQHAIGLEHLAGLDHDTLKDIGVPVVGHRITILTAAADDFPPGVSGDLPDLSPAPASAERRQLTVMFCDLLGSTELSQKLDPEDLRDVNRAYRDACKSAIERYDGYLARFVGDGALAYFGYPRAHEDDAERAIHSGLRVVRAVVELNGGIGRALDIELAVRVGIATGPVVAGDVIGEGASQESAVTGQTPNLAARLQDLAPRNSVVIAPGTRRLVAGRFELEDLGEQDLKGFSRPVHAFRALCAVEADSRFETIHGSGLTSLVGREHELGLLLERWQQAKEGDGQVALLSGEPGIGKSRIVETLYQRIIGDDPVRLRYQCSPYHTNSILHPVISHLERASRFTASDSAEQKLAKLETLLAMATSDVEQVAALFAELLSIPTSARYPALDMTPERQKDSTLEALVAQIAGLASRQPVLLVFEDVHWADPTSLALLERIVEGVQNIPVLAVVTHRPEFSPAWSHHTHITALTLNRFTRSLVNEMVARLTRGVPLSEDVRQQIVDKTDGVPLFVEELTKAVLESGAQDDRSTRQTRAETMIPVTLRDSLTARLDRLATGKPVAQAGAAIGREFAHQLLELVCDLPAERLDAALAELIDAGLVYRRGGGADTNYIFKHALVQDAAYESLLHSSRRNLHEQIARSLLARYPNTSETQPELLAHHFARADHTDRAVDYWLRAGRRASERAANEEAIGHLSAGLAQLLQLPDSPERARRELELQLELCGPCLSTRGWGAQVTEQTFARARELCTLLGETTPPPAVLYGEYMRELSSGHFQAATDVARELLRMGERQHDDEAILQGHRIIGWGSLYVGEFSVSREHVDEAFRLFSPAQHGRLRLRYGHDTRVAALCVRAILQTLCGYPDQARATAAEAVAYARSIDHEPTLAYALMNASALPAALRRDPHEAAEVAEQILQVSEHFASRVWSGYGWVVSGWAAAIGGTSTDASEVFNRGLDTLKQTSPHPWQPVFAGLQAEIHVSCGQTERALRALENALQIVEQTGERMGEAAIHDLLGNALLARDSRDTEKAEASFRKAISVARRQGAKTFELRAAASLARLLQNQGKASEARELLAPVHDWFTEGFDTPDVNRATELLAELS